MSQQSLLNRLRGAFPAAITPMTPAGEVDHVALAENLKWMNKMMLGPAGYVLLGSTGEQAHLSEFERALVLEIGRRHIPDEKVLIAGTGMQSTRLTIEETKRVAEAGADAALVVTPNYYQPLMKSATLIKHYRAVADASRIPILLYTVPNITGITIPPDAVAELSTHPNIIGMKNSSGEGKLASAYYDATAENDSFVILSGSAYAAPGYLLAGLAEGVILAAANVLPEVAAALVEDAQEGNIAEVRRHATALRQISLKVGRFGIGGWKAGVEVRGHHGGPARLPMPKLTKEEKEFVAHATKEIFEAWAF